MRTKQGFDETKEKVIYGCLFGLILFASSVIYVSVLRNAETVKALLPYVPAALVGYLAVGNLLIWLYTRPYRGNMGRWFNGSAAVYTIGLLVSAVAFVAFWIPEIIRYMILINVVIVLICWILDYCFFMKVANELNGGTKKLRCLVVDLQECPRSVEAFCREIEDYCRKNGRRLEFIKREKNAEIRMDGELYTVELDSFYSVFGPMYALKFRQVR